MGSLVPKKGMERRIMEGTVAHLSPRKALTVAPGDCVMEAVKLMRAHNVGSVLVADGVAIVGVLSERELLFKTDEASDLNRTRVSAVMRTHPTLLREDDEVGEVFHRMALSGHRHMPIQLRDGSCGVVSARDLLRYLCQ